MVSVDGQQGEGVQRRKSPRVAGESPGPGLFGVQGEPCEPHLATVLCVGTFGGCHLGVECGAEWQYLQLQLQSIYIVYAESGREYRRVTHVSYG